MSTGTILTEATIASSTSPADRHFETDHLHADLKGRSIRGGAVTLGAQAIKFVLQMGSTAILARLITPADFGLVAMVSAVTGLIGVLGDLGLSAATVQRAEITHKQVSTLFWISVGASVALSVIAAALAPAIAWFYHEPRLIWITLAVSGTFVFGGLTAQHYALLVRQMRFGAMAAVQTLPLLASAAIGIALALAGWGYWALVTMGIVGTAGTALVAWIASGWWPGLPVRGSGVRSMLAFGGHLTGFNILSYLTRNGDNVLIGRFLGSAPLGIYAKAYGLLMMPIQQINAPVNGVVLPALSRLQDQPDRFRSYFLKAVGGLAFIGMPLTAFAFVDADSLVLTVLGPQWVGAVPIFRLLAPAALLGTINSAPAWIFTSLGRADRQLWWACISTPIILAGFAVGLVWGAAGVAASFSVTFGLCFVAFAADACRHSPVRFRDLAGAVIPPLGASAVAALLVFACQAVTHFAAPLRLAVDAALYALIYGTLCLTLPGGRAIVGSLRGQYGRKANRAR